MPRESVLQGSSVHKMTFEYAPNMMIIKVHPKSGHYHVYVIIIVSINLVKSNNMAWERYQDPHSLAH